MTGEAQLTLTFDEMRALGTACSYVLNEMRDETDRDEAIDRDMKLLTEIESRLLGMMAKCIKTHSESNN